MLMNSANDAAIALGKHIAGSQDAFADLMNQKAKQMGLADTHFCTPSGLEPDGRESECYSSAADIARVAAYSMRFDTIWKMFGYPNNSQITSCDGQVAHTLINSDILLDDIPNCLGGKTGFTPAAGYSLLMGVSDATHLHRIVIVLLDDPYRWQDIRTAIDWTFRRILGKSRNIFCYVTTPQIKTANHRGGFLEYNIRIWWSEAAHSGDRKFLR